MIGNGKLVFFIFFYLFISPAVSNAAQSPVIAYPGPLLAKLGISSKDIVKNQKKFKTDKTHLEWMAHVHEVLPGINPDTEAVIINLHTAMLYLKDRINTAYLSGSISQQEFTADSAQLMKWFLQAHQTILSKKEYDALFGISGNNEQASVMPTGSELGFPIENPETTVDMIKKEFDERTINNLSRFYQQHSQELRDIKKIYETGNANVKPEQIKNDMQRIEKELQTAYKNYCRKTLTNKQFKMIFGGLGDKK